MKRNRIAILGAGTGGLVVANELAHLAPQQDITLIERDRIHAFAPSFLWLMTGDRRPEQIAKPVVQLLRPGITLIKGEVQRIDLPNQTVQTDAGDVEYDHLVVALGAALDWSSVDGINNAHTFYTFAGAEKLRSELSSFRRGTVALVIASTPYKCPGAPHEGAMLIADFFRRKDRKVEVHLFTPESQPLPVAGPELGKAVEEMLQRRGIFFHPLHKLIGVNTQSKEISFQDKPIVHYDLLIAIPPHRVPEMVVESGLAKSGGWVSVDRGTLETNHENVYAIGDIAGISIPGRWKPDVPLMLPKAGVFAHMQGTAVARRIAAKIYGNAAGEVFCGDGYCMLEAGEDLAGFAFGNFFAEPSPEIHLKKLGKTWHLGKVLFEKWWLQPYGLKKSLIGTTLRLGSKAVGLPNVF
ncbi:NAD(P)/FAD-dependent oxidoreductase [bacterium]|nr:NAD(P)/FAD-dependent oxidoreductase [bacterium]